MAGRHKHSPSIRLDYVFKQLVRLPLNEHLSCNQSIPLFVSYRARKRSVFFAVGFRCDYLCFVYQFIYGTPLYSAKKKVHYWLEERTTIAFNGNSNQSKLKWQSFNRNQLSWNLTEYSIRIHSFVSDQLICTSNRHILLVFIRSDFE